VGMSRGAAAAPASRSFRVALYDMTLLVVFLVGGLLTLATVFPRSFDLAADPLTTPPNARPPWYLLAPHALQQALPSFIPSFLRGLFLEAVFAVVLFLPFIDRSPTAATRRRGFVYLGLAICVGWVLLTWMGWHMEVRR
jgi:quinol-cytochrome oxidoreductase complex cytochrome b subunit